MKNLKTLLFATFLCLSNYLNAATISSTPQGGLWDSESTWVGGKLPQITDDVIITSVVTTGSVSYSSRTFKMANLTVNAGGKILREADKSGRYSLEIYGNLVNNGEIIDYLDYFDIFLYGNLENNGVFKPRLVYLKGTNQHISTTAPIECKTFNFDMTDNEVFASSNLLFKNCYIPSNGTKTLNMGLFNLSLQADSVTYSSYYGEIYSNCKLSAPVQFEETGILELDKSIIGKTIYGNCMLKSPSYAFITDLTVEGNLTLAENTKVSSTENLIKLKVKGDFINFSELNKDSIYCPNIEAPVRSMKLYVYGNINNIGTTGTTTTVYPITNGDTISLQGNFNGDVEIRQAEDSSTPGGKVIINNDVSILGDLYVYSNLEIVEGGDLNMSTKVITNPIYVGSGTGSISNNGNIHQYHRFNSSWSYRTFSNKTGMSVDYELRDWEGQVDGVEVSVFNGKTYPNLPGSTKRWWRLKPIGDGKVTYYTLKLFYDESQLNGQKEENLKVYRSTDEGETWEVISVGEYTEHNTEENYISIGTWSKNESMLTEFGDFVISSGDGSVPVESPVKSVLVGREGVRVGAPNLFSAYLYNITDYELDGFIFAIAKSDDIFFDEFQLKHQNETEIIPIDSIGSASDTLVMFYVTHMAPNQEISLDFIVHGVTDEMKSTQVNGTFVSLLKLVSGEAAKDKVEQTVKQKVYDRYKLSEEELKKYADLTGRKIEELRAENKREFKNTLSFHSVSKKVATEVIKKLPGGKVINVVGETLEFANDVKQPFYRRFWLAMQGDLEVKNKYFGQNSGKVEVQNKACELRQSWDPNEIVGPSGYGDQNFMSSIPRMNYTIMFENKKEATAPAYRIQIIDTLSSAFNPETVTFDGTSHSAANYNWKMERNGNIIKWDIEGIELVPNATPPEGEGFVRFSVGLNDAVKHGDVIANCATIIFDMNAPIQTNTWINTLDFEAPKTKMNSIDYSAGDTLITLSCNSDDGNGAGAAYYGWYASYNDGPFLFIGETFSNEIEYAIHSDSINNYRFFALATDYVDNAENTVPEYIHLKTEPLSIDHVSMPHNFKVYPNPTSGIINVQTNSYLKGAYNCTLISILGENCLSFTINDKPNVTFDIRKLHNGIYLLKIEKDNLETEIHRVVKQ